MRRRAIATLARRIGLALLIVWGVTSGVWLLTALLPGDPARAALGPNASPADVEKARQLWGLDRPLPVRYARFMSGLLHRGHGAPVAQPGKEHATCAEIPGGLHLDLGMSYTYRKPVVELVKKKLPNSLELALGAMFVQILLGVGLGAAAAMKRGQRLDEIIVAGSTAMSAAPTFVIGLGLQYLLAHRLGWLPLDGQGIPPAERMRAMILPALTLGLYGTAVLTRLVRAELGDALQEPFVRTARAKGASRLRATLVHALRNAIAPIAQLAVLELGALVGGAIVTERLFRWPGLGEMAILSIQSRDAQALVGVTLVASVAVVMATLFADLVGMLLDPRKRDSE